MGAKLAAWTRISVPWSACGKYGAPAPMDGGVKTAGVAGVRLTVTGYVAQIPIDRTRHREQAAAAVHRTRNPHSTACESALAAFLPTGAKDTLASVAPSSGDLILSG